MLIGYARVSTQDQNPELQIEALKKAGCEKIFVEHASGAKRNRAQLKEALDYVREGDVLVVWKLDRLARSIRQLIEVVEGLSERGIGFKVLTDNIDTSTPGGQLVFHIFGALAQFERELIRERTRAGLEVARKSGRRGGRPPKLTEQKRQLGLALLRDKSIPIPAIIDQLGISRSAFYAHFPGGRSAVLEG